jgi:hypothetical protein
MWSEGACWFSDRLAAAMRFRSWGLSMAVSGVSERAYLVLLGQKPNLRK